MKQEKGIRQLKKKIFALLSQTDFEEALEEIRQMPPMQVINPLFSFFYSGDETIKSRAITAAGTVAADMAEQHIESARIIMRRLMWNLNEESGGIGWGSPEAMGEIMAKSKRLAEEYHCILISYIREDGNFIEHEELQKGVLWGIKRLAEVRPDMLKYSIPFFDTFLKSKNLVIRKLAEDTVKTICR